jgi:hypothetical protein
MMTLFAKLVVAVEHVEPYMVAEVILTVWELVEMLVHHLG